MKIDFARLNHVLIPTNKEERDRFRSSRFGRAIVPLVSLFWGSLTDEGRTLAFATVLVGAFALDVQRSSAFVFFAALTGLLVGSLLASRRLRLDHVTVSVDAPRRVTVGEPVVFSIDCKTRHPVDGALRRLAHPIRIRGPFLPWDGRWLAEPPTDVELDARGRATVRMGARFVARGLHHLDPFDAFAIAPLGLAGGPRLATEAVKIHVVPRVANVVRLPQAIGVRHQPGGVALASKSGEAMDLLGVRPYRPGDPVRDLHARSWARTGVPVVREYLQEYFTRVGVVLDTDESDPDRLERAVELAAGVIAHLSRGEALVDVLVVGEHVHELTVGRSLGYLDQALDLLSTVERGPELRAADLLRNIEPHLERLSSVVVILLREGSEQNAITRAIEERGITCTTLVVDEAIMRRIRAAEPLAW